MAARVVNLDEVWAALKECAPGYSVRKSDHVWIILHPTQKNVVARLPLGKHGRRMNAEIEAGHVRQMARAFEIEECMQKRIPSAYG